MARNKSPADQMLDEVVKQAVTAVLKPLGFRKSGNNFHRRHGEVVQVVNLQMSRGCSWDLKQFYVNVGLAFDEICRLMEVDILEKLKEHDCDERGTRGRLERLIPFAPEQWTVAEGDDAAAMVRTLRFFFRQLAVELEQLDGIKAYRDHRWFSDRWRPRKENAQVLYLLGDLEAARREIVDLCDKFANVKEPPTFDRYVERLHLAKLRGRAPASGSSRGPTWDETVRKALTQASFILFPAPGISLSEAVAAFNDRGLTAALQGDTATVSWTGDVRFSIQRAQGEATKQQSVWIGEGADFSDLSNCDCRFEIVIGDLEKAIDEVNTLIEVQSTLQAATGGYLFNCWNGQLCSPD